MKLILALLITALMITGCQQSNSANSRDTISDSEKQSKPDDIGKIYEEEKPGAASVIVELPKLAAMTPDEVSKTFGKPFHEVHAHFLVHEHFIDHLRAALEHGTEDFTPLVTLVQHSHERAERQRRLEHAGCKQRSHLYGALHERAIGFRIPL